MIRDDIDFIRQILADTVLFRGTDKQSIKMLSEQTDAVKFIKKGETIYTPEEFAHSLGIVIDGVCRAKNICGNKTVLLNEFGQGDIFGAAALFTDDVCYVSEIVAATDCTIVFISQQLAEKFIETDSTFAKNYIVFLSDKIRFLNKKINRFTAKTPEDRVLEYLKAQPVAEDGHTLIKVDMKNLASVLGISRATLYRALDTLQEENKITKNGTLISLPQNK
ncbi:MAG: Crp/Fnr family transcriptional regulator [Ruminococcaceae bacterium]|nr:Crp/Fnr family transcriptional regulator [Oscillospiraceae bacterium]